MRVKKRGRLAINRKSQITIFIIMALLIIILGVTYFLYQKTSVEKEIEVVQPEVAPVKQYVENCIKSAAEDGLLRIGLSGGYINVPESVSRDPRAYLEILPSSSFKMPYWRYNGINAVPSEQFINQQLRTHIKSRIKSCVNGFEPFRDRYNIKELKEPVVDVGFNENDVSVSLNYPIEIALKSGDFKAAREDFAYNLPVRFKKVYELAKLIMEMENIDYFLERRTIDLYSMDKEIPTTDIEARCSAKTWRLSSIKQELQNILRVNLPYIRIKGTDYNPELYVPNPNGKSVYSDTYFQNHYVWEIDPEPGKKFSNMKVGFAYENWQMRIYARPSENGILKSNAQKGSNALSFFCLHIWHFTYDIEYPIVVTVFDQETNSNKEYRFSFPFKVAIEHNQPSKANTGSTLFESIPDISSEEFCNDVRNEISVYTLNNATGEDLRGVNLTFVCGGFYCDAGETEYLSFGAASGIAKRLPYCVNGIIKGVKNSFADSQMFIQTDADKSYVLLLNPLKEFQNYKIVKHPLSNPAASEELAENEKATIIIKGKENGIESYAVYPKESEEPLRLLDSKDAAYDLTIYLANDENIIGGYSGEWKVKKEQLLGSEITFHIITQEAASEDERALFVAGLDSYSKNVPVPEIK